MSQEPTESSTDELEAAIADAIEDPDIPAFTFACVDSNGFASTYGESEGDENSYRTLCAAVLMQFASSSDDPEEEFIRDVINEYNARKKTSQANHGAFGPNE
ncbi:hypothetical protein [Natrinema thermotolerans]